MLYHEVTLSLDTLATVWRKENFGDLHNTLVDAVYWHDDRGQREALGKAAEELAHHGLLGGNQLNTAFRDTLEVVAHPTVEFFGWLTTQDSECAVLVAANGQEAVVAVREGKQVRLHPAHPDGLAEALVARLPPTPPARGRAVNLPEAGVRELLAHRGDAPPGLGKPLPSSAYRVFSRASEVEDATELMAALDQPRIGAGELYVAARVGNGVRRRCQHQINYVDTAAGRWMTQLSGDQPGQRWLVAAPASRQLLISKLREMLNQLYV